MGRSDQTWTIEEVAKYLNMFPKTENDRFVGCAGSEGSGKSIYSILTTKSILEQRKKKFELKEILHYDRKKMVKSLEDNYDGAYIDDEAVREFSRTFYKKEQIEYVKMTKVIRFHRHIVFKNIPILWELDRSLRNRIAIYFFIRKKPMNGKPGRAWFFQREERAFGTDPWNIKENLKLERAGKIWMSPNYFGEVLIPNLSGVKWFTDLEKEYKELKDSEKHGAYGAESGDYTDARSLAEFLVKLDDIGALKYGCFHDVADGFGVSYGHLRNEVSVVRRKNKNNKLVVETSTTTSKEVLE